MSGPAPIYLSLPKDTSLAAQLNHALIENLPVGVYLCDEQGIVIAYNRKASEIWGREPVLGDSQEKYCGSMRILNMQGVHIPHDLTPLATIYQTREPTADMHVLIERPDGSRVPVSATVIPLFNEANVMIGFVNSVTDLSQALAQEAERLVLSDTLFQSQKMEVVGQLTSGLAHDFNNQLASVQAALSLMEKEIQAGDNERLRAYHSLGVEAAKRAGALAANLMNFSRKRAVDLCQIKPAIVLKEIGNLIVSSLGHHITLSAEVATDAWPFEANLQHLESAILNLVLNARDAMPAGGTLTIRATNVTLDALSAASMSANFESGEYLCLLIADTGMGMPPEVQEKIFVPFYTTKEAGKGTGLGLAMVLGFVTDMNGEIVVHSIPGKGTRFELYFPRYGSPHSRSIKYSNQ